LKNRGSYVVITSVDKSFALWKPRRTLLESRYFGWIM